MKTFSQSECAAKLENLTAWSWQNGKLCRTFNLPNFVQALALANRIGDLAEQHDHHPDLHVSYGKLHVEVYTHSAGGITEKDFSLAAAVNQLNP